MSWLTTVEGDELGDVLARRPELAALIAEAEQHAASALPGRLRELCARRAAQLARLPAQPLPPTEELTDAERCVVGLCEQFVIDAHGITDDAVAQVQQYLSAEEVVALFANLALIDGFTKLQRLMTTGGS